MNWECKIPSAKPILMDFTFVTAKVLNSYESDEITKEDLMRFRGYEAVLSYQQKKDVFTCVLCTADTKVLLDEIQTGMNVYRVKVVRLKDWNADEVLHALETKQGDTQPLNKEELLKLILLPLMSGHMKQKERIARGFHVLHSEREYQEQAELQRMEGVLYILAEKFLNKTDLEELKEEIKVTRLGQMLFDDGWNEGMAQGISQGMAQGISQGMAQGISQGMAQGISQGMAQGISQGMAQGISQGMAKGMAQGISQGITTGMADMILGFLTDLGAVPQRVTDMIRSTKDENKLRTWGKIAGRAESMEEFYEKTGIEKELQ